MSDNNKKKDEYKTGFFNKLIGKDPFYTKGMRETADAQFNQRMSAQMKKKLKKAAKKQQEKMGDIEYKFQKKYSNPPRKPKT
jgi:hypothetical protein